MYTTKKIISPYPVALKLANRRVVTTRRGSGHLAVDQWQPEGYYAAKMLPRECGSLLRLYFLSIGAQTLRQIEDCVENYKGPRFLNRVYTCLLASKVHINSEQIVP